MSRELPVLPPSAGGSDERLAGLTLIFGVLSLLLSVLWPVGFACGLVAVVFGVAALYRVRTGRAGGSAAAWTGLVCSGIVVVQVGAGLILSTIPLQFPE